MLELEDGAIATESDAPAARSRFPAARIVLWLAVIGVALRVLRYVADRSLWLDEAYLANSILTYSWKQLLTRPLLQWQAAPVGFLMLQKLAVTLFGGSEYALRLVPLIAGIATLPLFHGIVRRTLAPTARVIAMALFATLDPLIYYASEAKQYELDVAFALAIVLAAIRVRERPQSGRRLAVLAAIGAVGLFCSHPAVFVAACAVIVLSGDLILSRDRGAAPRLAALGCLWAALATANYLLFLRALTRHAGLVAYWASDYMPREPLGAIKWLGLELFELYHGYATMWLPLVDTAIVATILGIAVFWRTQRAVLALLMLPLLMTLGAAAFHLYPFGSRLVLFLVPFVVVLIGAGGGMIWESFVAGRRWIAIILLGSLLVPTAVRDLFYVAFPQKREEIKPILAYIRDHKRPGDRLYVFHMSEVPFNYYKNRFGGGADVYGLEGMPTILGEAGERDPSIYAGDLARLRGKGRVWVLITHPRALGGIDEEQLFPEILDRFGKQLDRVGAFNACALLYDMRP